MKTRSLFLINSVIDVSADHDCKLRNLRNLNTFCTCRQLIQDQLPERKSQLYNIYGPGGSVPLIPAAQSGSPPLSIRTVDSANQFVEIFNGNPVAVDVSDYKLTGSASITLRAGMILLPGITELWKLTSMQSSIAKHACNGDTCKRVWLSLNAQPLTKEVSLDQMHGFSRPTFLIRSCAFSKGQTRTQKSPR